MERMTVQISFTADIDKDFYEELQSIIDHHIEYLIDTDSFSDEIESIYNAKVEVAEWTE